MNGLVGGLNPRTLPPLAPFKSSPRTYYGAALKLSKTYLSSTASHTCRLISRVLFSSREDHGRCTPFRKGPSPRTTSQKWSCGPASPLVTPPTNWFAVHTYFPLVKGILWNGSHLWSAFSVFPPKNFKQTKIIDSQASRVSRISANYVTQTVIFLNQFFEQSPFKRCTVLFALGGIVSHKTRTISAPKTRSPCQKLIKYSPGHFQLKKLAAKAWNGSCARVAAHNAHEY